jgi:hypothetical protein
LVIFRRLVELALAGPPIVPGVRSEREVVTAAAVREARRWLLTLNRLLGDLGMSPSARASLSVPYPMPEESEVDRLLSHPRSSS